MRSQRIISSVFRKHLAPYGVTNSQISLLFIITKIQTVTQKKLSELLFMEKSTVQRNLQRLLKRNLIRQDGKLLITTDEGFILVEEILPSWKKAMDEMDERLGEEGINGLNLLLNKLIKHE